MVCVSIWRASKAKQDNLGNTNAAGAANDENELGRGRRGSFWISGALWTWGLDDFLLDSTKCRWWWSFLRARNGCWIEGGICMEIQRWWKRKKRYSVRVFWEISSWYWKIKNRSRWESGSHGHVSKKAEEGKRRWKQQFMTCGCCISDQIYQNVPQISIPFTGKQILILFFGFFFKRKRNCH